MHVVVVALHTRTALMAQDAPTSSAAFGVELLEKLLSTRERPTMPIHSHADRIPSGRRGISLDGLRALRPFFGASAGIALYS